jgi:hypothetical protein
MQKGDRKMSVTICKSWRNNPDFSLLPRDKRKSNFSLFRKLGRDRVERIITIIIVIATIIKYTYHVSGTVQIKNLILRTTRGRSY